MPTAHPPVADLQRRLPTAPPTASTAATATAAGPSAAAGAVPPGEVGWLAGQVLRCTYDLFLDMEEQRQMLPEDQKCVCKDGEGGRRVEGEYAGVQYMGAVHGRSNMLCGGQIC